MGCTAMLMLEAGCGSAPGWPGGGWPGWGCPGAPGWAGAGVTSMAVGWTVTTAGGTAAARLQMGWMAEMVCTVGITGGCAIDVIDVMLGWMASGCARLARLTTATAPGGPCSWEKRIDSVWKR